MNVMKHMQKTLLLSGWLWLGLATSLHAQPSIINTSDYSDEQLSDIRASVPTDGWVLIQHQEERYLLNVSNREYTLSLACQDSKQPSYLIEYARAYRDGTFDGIDLVSSSRQQFAKVVFEIDGHAFEDPFTPATAKEAQSLIAALKQGKTLTVKVYDTAFNPETATETLALNRSINFKLNHSALLDEVTPCR